MLPLLLVSSVAGLKDDSCPNWCLRSATRSWACATLECAPCIEACLGGNHSGYNSQNDWYLRDLKDLRALEDQQRSWKCSAAWPPRRFFVIFGAMRSASTTACSAINTLDNAQCAYELLNLGSWSKAQVAAGWTHPHVQHVRTLLHSDPIRFVHLMFENPANPLALAEGGASAPGAPEGEGLQGVRTAPCVWGFKVFKDHLRLNATFHDWLWRQLDVAIVLERKDLGAQARSLLAARKSHCWTTGNCPKVEVHPSADQLASHRQETSSWYSELHRRAAMLATTARSNGKRVLHVTTEGMLATSRSQWRPSWRAALSVRDAVTISRARLDGSELFSGEMKAGVMIVARAENGHEEVALSEHLTLGVKHMSDYAERRSSLAELVASVRQHHSTLPILVAYEGAHAYLDGLCEKYLHCGSGSVTGCAEGLAAGRNALVAHARTEFVMIVDDDVLFHAHTRIGVLVAQLRANTALALVAACYHPADCFAHNFASDGRGSWHLDPVAPPVQRTASSAPVAAHVVQNAYVARTAVLRAHPWDARQQMMEHETFFAALASAGSSHTPPRAAAPLACPHTSCALYSADSRTLCVHSECIPPASPNRARLTVAGTPLPSSHASRYCTTWLPGVPRTLWSAIARPNTCSTLVATCHASVLFARRLCCSTAKQVCTLSRTSTSTLTASRTVQKGRLVFPDRHVFPGLPQPCQPWRYCCSRLG